jgi:predicted MFS family arabinose efflux permease
MPREFYLITGITLSFFVASQIIQPILPLYIIEKGANNLDLGIIISLISFTAIVAKIPLSALSEKLGRYPFIPILIVGQAFSLMLYSVAENPQWFYPIRILHAFVLAGFFPTVISIIQELAPEGERGLIIGAFLTAVGSSSFLGPFIASFLANYVEYEGIFQIASLIPLFGLCFHFLIRRKMDIKQDIPRSNPPFLTSLKVLISSRPMIVLSYLRFTFSFTYAFFLTLFALHAENTLLFSTSSIALLFGVSGITNTIIRMPCGKILDSINPKIPLFLSFALLTGVYLTISEVADFDLMVLFMILYGASQGIRVVTEWSILSECAPSEVGNVATAYLSTVFNVGAAFGSIAAGFLFLFFDISFIFKLAAFIIFSGAVIVHFCSPEHVKRKFTQLEA